MEETEEQAAGTVAENPTPEAVDVEADHAPVADVNLGEIPVAELEDDMLAAELLHELVRCVVRSPYGSTRLAELSDKVLGA